MNISVVIITKNEEKNIDECLRSVVKQSFPRNRYEIILVDAHSTDDTVKIAQQYTDKIFFAEPSMPVQRNIGISNSGGKYILLLDADMRLHEELLAHCYAKMIKNSELVALYVEEIILGDRFFHKIRRFERSFYSATVVDCVRFIRKDVLLKIGGYDENVMIGEDWDLDRRINEIGKTKLMDTPLYHDERRLSYKGYIEKKSYYPTVMNDYMLKWGKNDSIIRMQFGVRYRFFGVFVEHGKWKKLLRHPILAFGMYWLRFLVGVKYIMRSKG